MEINKICVVCGGRLIVGDDSKWEQNEKGEWFCPQEGIKNRMIKKENEERMVERRNKRY